MAKYQSFESNNRKIEKSFEKVNSNESKIKNEVKKINKNYTSQIYYKGFQGGDILSNIDVTNDPTVVIELINFPEWAINMLKPYHFYSFPSAYSVEQADDKLVEKFNNGDITLNDIQLNTLSFFEDSTKYWFVKKDNLYTFNLRFDTNFQFVSSKSMFGFSFSPVQTFSTVGLIFNNNRNYELVQSGK